MPRVAADEQNNRHNQCWCGARPQAAQHGPKARAHSAGTLLSSSERRNKRISDMATMPRTSPE
eukprot:scaffold21688_cov31-Tisochrysis_lutea.AAC.2